MFFNIFYLICFCNVDSDLLQHTFTSLKPIISPCQIITLTNRLKTNYMHIIFIEQVKERIFQLSIKMLMTFEKLFSKNFDLDIEEMNY